MISYRLLFGSILTFLLSGYASGQWISESVPVTENLNSIDLTNENTGWIVGDNGTMLYRQMDTWLKYQNITGEDLNSVCLLSQTDGWTVGTNGTILRFNGIGWEQFPSPTKNELFSVSFRDAGHGIASGARGTLLLYENGAWRQIKNKIRGNIYAVADMKTTAMAVGGLECLSVPVMILSGESEKKLVSAFDPGFIEIKSLAVPDNKNVWATGSYGTVFHYDGSTWSKTELGKEIPTLNSVFFADDNHGIAVGYSGAVLTYSPAGWSKEESFHDVKLNDAAIFGSKYYAVGDNGTVISKKIEKNETVPVNDSEKTLLISSYPNPSRDYLKIIIPQDLDSRSGVISVSNLNGKIVFKESFTSLTGGQDFPINTSNLRKGLYLVNITSEGISASGKFIIR